MGFERRIGERQRADSVLAADQRWGAGRDRRDEMVELGAIGLRIALQEEWQWFVADDAVAAGKDDRAFRDIPGLQPAIGPERLDPLVVAVDRAPAVRDVAKRAGFHPQAHDGRV